MAATDNHGNSEDTPTVKACLQFAKDFKPKERFHLGDGYNFNWLRGKASEGEKRESTVEDIEAGNAFLRAYKPTRYLTGNHCYRLWKATESDDGKLRDFACSLLVDIKDALGDAIVYPWCKRKGVLTYGNYSFIHGFASGVYAARQAALIYGNVVQGHVHAADTCSLAGYPPKTGHTCAALCKLDLDYNRGQPGTLRQSNGWIYGFRHSNGELEIHHARKIGGSWYLPTEFKEIR
jgi:hypothetical protein